MTDQPLDQWAAIETVITEMTTSQQETLLRLGRQIIPTLTSEDLLQPNDYFELESQPFFRYEEGILAGIRSVHMALCALKKDQVNAKYIEGDLSK